jgi:hypothetical protein
MTNSTPPPQPPTLTLVEKLYAVNNVVPVKLNIDELNYSSWWYFFKIHCDNFGVLKHIKGASEAVTSSNPPPPTDEWKTADLIVKSPTLQGRLIKINPKTSKDAWEHVEKIFLNNKRTLQLL